MRNFKLHDTHFNLIIFFQFLGTIPKNSTFCFGTQALLHELHKIDQTSFKPDREIKPEM